MEDSPSQLSGLFGGGGGGQSMLPSLTASLKFEPTALRVYHGIM